MTEVQKKTTVTVGPLTLGTGIPKLCIPVVGATEVTFLANLHAAIQAEPDLIELRIDTLHQGDPEEVLRQAAKAASDIPLLLTCRSQRDGGEGSPETYADLLFHLLHLNPGFSLIDLEISAGEPVFTRLRQAATDRGIPVIGSWHSFSGTPDADEILRRYTCIEAWGASVAKVALMTHCAEDVDRLCSCARQASALLRIPLIAISMGPLGARTRTDCEQIGSCMTFASAGTESAPGQMPAAAVREALRKRHDKLTEKG